MNNLAEVIHASYEKRDQKGLSFLKSAEVNTRYSWLLESELEGRGPNMISLKKQFFKKQREAAAQKGSDFISFGIELSSHGKRKN